MTAEVSSVHYKIYDGSEALKSIPKVFETITIALEADQKSDLNWNEALAIADAAILKNFKIFWDLKLGLFDKLNSPLSNHPQFLNLKLAVEHFKNVVWTKYMCNSIGVCLYRGRANFTDSFRWGDKETANLNEYLQVESKGERQKLIAQFCQCAAIDYIKLLAEELPDDAEPFALIDISGIDSLVDQARWQDSSLASPLRFALKGTQIPLNHQLAWNLGNSPLGYISSTALKLSHPNSSIAVCMPSILEHKDIQNELEKLLVNLNSHDIPYRLISEDKLTVEWDQLDYLMVISKAVTSTAMRMLLGFCAAGGTVLHLGSPLGLEGELPFSLSLLYEMSTTKHL
ncbi:MAG: hypothetical protein H0U49_10950 [Parachlamydiaceae bacterium]|nr:hypothetical protein [Parachlamydiaceae bacterium]